MQYFELKENKIREHFIPEKLQISRYDADNETFLITVDEWYGKIVLYVPLAIAPNFKKNWETIRQTMELEFRISDDIELKSMTFNYDNIKLCYDSTMEIEYNQPAQDEPFQNLE